MRPMPQVTTMSLKPRKAILLGTSALVCFALAAPVMADDFIITSSDGSSNGVGTTDGGTAAVIADTAINGSDTVSLGIALTITGTNNGIKTNNNDTEEQSNTVTVTGTGSITTGKGTGAQGIFNDGAYHTTTVSGSIETGGTLAHGILNWGNTNTATISGSITTTGTDNGNGIRNYGDDNKITISGTVKTTGTNSAALLNSLGSGNSFTLDEGAIIIGDILARDHTDNDLDATNSKLIFNLGASTSYAYSVSGKGEGTTAGQWDFDDLDERTQAITTTGTGCDTNIDSAGNDTCNLVTAVGNGNAKAQDELQFGMNTSMIGSLKRHDKPAAAAATFALSTDTTPDTLDEGKYSTPQKSMPSTQVLKRNVWANVLGRHKRTVFNHNSIIL